MGVARERWSTSASLLLAAVAAILLPSLLTSASDAPGSVAVGLLALALAGLASVGPGCRVVAAHARTTVGALGHEVIPVLSGRVTDPVHHPLRPRAPGPS